MDNRQAIDDCTHAFTQRENKIKELETVLEAWFHIFETNQLTHAQCRLEVAEKDAKKYHNLIQKLDIEKIAEAIDKSYTESERKDLALSIKEWLIGKEDKTNG